MDGERVVFRSFHGDCLSQVLISFKDDIITSCMLKGKCPGNLKVLSENLVGEKIETAYKCIDTCPKNNDCTRELERILLNIFAEIAEGMN